MYIQDYDELFPLAAYADGRLGFQTWHELTDSYARNTTIWHCLESRVRKADADGRVTTHFGYNIRYLTTMAPDFSNAARHTAVSLASVELPAETVLLADAEASIPRSFCGDDGKFLLPPSAGAAHCWGRPALLHSGGAQLLWVDGHVKWARDTQFYVRQTPVDRYFDLR